MSKKKTDFEKITGFKSPKDFAEYQANMVSIKVAYYLADALYKYNCKGKRKLLEELLKVNKEFEKEEGV